MTTNLAAIPRTSAARRDAEHLRDLLARERQSMADFLLALAAFDLARRWADLGHASLWAFLHVDLGLSVGAAHWRKVAAQLVAAFPAVERGLREGELCLSSVVELAKVLTRENQAEVIPRFRHLSSREAKAVVAEFAPAAAFPTRERITVPERLAGRLVIGAGSTFRTPETLATQPREDTRIQLPSPDGHAATSPEPPTTSASSSPTGSPIASLAAQDAGASRVTGAEGLASTPIEASTPPIEPVADESAAVVPTADALPAPSPAVVACSAAAPPLADAATPSGDTNAPSSRRKPDAPARPATGPDEVVPLTGDLRRLHLTVTRRFIEKLATARRARAHAQPGASSGDVLEAALDLLLARDAARRKAEAQRPVGRLRESAPGRIRASVRREVWRRDEGRCQWPLEGGGVCGSTWRLELDHVHPRSRGGPSTAENLRLLCGPHNAEAARRAFGEAFMARRRAASADAPERGPRRRPGATPRSHRSRP